MQYVTANFSRRYHYDLDTHTARYKIFEYILLIIIIIINNKIIQIEILIEILIPTNKYIKLLSSLAFKSRSNVSMKSSALAILHRVQILNVSLYVSK